jgi:hypothetical protein
MYDGEMFNATMKTIGSYSIGQMELYDVGFASMFVSEARCAFSNRLLHSRMLLDPKHVRLK